MIKLQPPSQDAGAYHNFRCGEVLCIGATTYHVCCALCGQKLAYESFPQHFRLKHLTETEDCKLFEAQPEDEDTVEEEQQFAVKAEEDPIAHETYEEEADVDLAQIALLDQEPEPGTELADTEPTCIRQRRRRSAALMNTLVLQQDDEEAELPLDEAIDNVELLSHEPNDNDNDNENDEDEDEDENDDADVDSQSVDDAKDMLFQCDQCERAYNTKRGLQGHKRNKHGAKAEASTISSTSGLPAGRRKRKGGPAKIYKCNECEQTFRTERDLRGHRWKHTGIFCDICGKPFSQSGNMMRHRQRHSGIKPYKCAVEECAATFYTQKELTSHNICHTGRMPCICEVCGRPCRDRGVLTAHMRRHTGERPAKCEVCGKAFYSFHDLNVHAVSHTSLRPFVCDVCGSTFQRKKALRVHKLLHSEQRKYACKLCSKTFAQSGGLNAHMRTHESAKTAAKSNANAIEEEQQQVEAEADTETETNAENKLADETTELTISLAVEPAHWHVP